MVVDLPGKGKASWGRETGFGMRKGSSTAHSTFSLILPIVLMGVILLDMAS
jgi:hypothetical protein